MGYLTDGQLTEVYRNAINEGYGHEDAVSITCEKAGANVAHLCEDAYFEDTFGRSR